MISQKTYDMIQCNELSQVLEVAEVVEEEEEDKQEECEEYQSFFRDVIGQTFVIACLLLLFSL